MNSPSFAGTEKSPSFCTGSAAPSSTPMFSAWCARSWAPTSARRSRASAGTAAARMSSCWANLAGTRKLTSWPRRCVATFTPNTRPRESSAGPPLMPALIAPVKWNRS